MGSLLGIGTAYGVSAALIVYAIERDLVEQGVQLPLIIAWAVAGLVLAVVAALRNREKA